MRITVNDTELYFDVEGPALVPDGPTMRERPTMLVLHGGPGFDHAYFKPALSALADTAQVVYLDLRCQGRSGTTTGRDLHARADGGRRRRVLQSPWHRSADRPRPLGRRLRGAPSGAASSACRWPTDPGGHRRRQRGHG